MYSRSLDDEISYFGQTNYRDTRQVFGIRQRDRRSHMYIIGKTGTGKSTLLEMLIRQDVAAGRGLALLDPHGDLIERITGDLPEGRRQDVIHFNVPDATAELAHASGFPPISHGTLPTAVRLYSRHPKGSLHFAPQEGWSPWPRR